jgi:AcrR family transcriptional regulator
VWAALGCPEVADSRVKIRAPHQQTRCKPRLPSRGMDRDEREPPDEPVERAELQENGHEPLPHRADPCRPDFLDGVDDVPLCQDAVNDRAAAADHSSDHQSDVVPVHHHTPLYGLIPRPAWLVNTLVYGRSMSDRLTKSEWLRQGLRTLASDGPGALKVGRMSEKLSVSRGSFYWHFRDIEDFRSQLLQRWQEISTDQVITELDSRPGDPGRLKKLMHRAFSTQRNLDQAIRSWSAHDQNVARIVAAVDVRRIGRVARLLVEAGLDSERAAHRAAFLYWAFLGQPAVMDRRHASLPARALTDIISLFEDLPGMTSTVRQSGERSRSVRNV